MTTKTLTLSTIAASTIFASSAFAESTQTANELDPIVVSADFREAKLSETSNSISIIGEEELYDKASDNFENIIGKTANVNFASGGSRAHHIQIRGIGERGQFQYPLNPSVGINVDGMDFSNNALAVTPFDVKQIEILKGPQGTTFGANGMAGVINIQSNEPTEETEGHIEATIGNYNTKALGAAVGGTLIDKKLLGRFSIYKNDSDGFTKNTYLNRKDTNNIDELTTKAQLKWLVSDDHTIDLNLMHLNINNGYDAFTLDNSRNSHADAPGDDTQETNGISLKSTYQINSKMHMISKIDFSDSDNKYSYDTDWSYAGEIIDGAEQFVGTDSYTRNRKNLALDIRLISDDDGRIFNDSTDWTFGAYHQNQDHTLDRFVTYSEPGYAESKTLNTKYETESTAFYGQLDTDISDKLTIISGVRAERWKAKYNDKGLKVADFSADSLSTTPTINHTETLYGGKLGLNYEVDENTLIYTSLSKGYKPGGVNIDAGLDNSQKTYETEALWNFETGLNSSHFDNKLKSRLNFFYAKRKDQQISTSTQDGADFTEYLGNAARGKNYGIESKLDFYPTDSLHLYSNIGLLKTKFDEYNNPNPAVNNLTGRDQAQSPKYQFNIGTNYNFASDWMIHANVEGKDSYYFGNTSNNKIDGHHLFNTSLEYFSDNWSATLWARNITDESYQVKGYYFDNKIAGGWTDAEVFTQQGMPRTVGITVSRDF